MARVGTAEYDVEINRAKVAAEVASTSRQIETGLGGSARKVGNEFSNMQRAAVAGFGVVAGAAVLNEFTQAASNLEQSIGATETVFGQASAVIDQYAKDSVEAFGLSERAFRESVAPTGAMLQALGFTEDAAAKTSVRLTSLAADFSAAFGGSTADAIGAVNAAIRGEFDTIERYGVKLSAANVERKALELGLADSKAALTDNAKAQATLALITEQGGKVAGQFAREADTVAVKQQKASAEFENTKAALGEALLPVMAEGVEVFSAFARVAAQIPGPVLAAGLAVGGTVAAVGLLGPIVKSGVQLLGEMGSAARRTATDLIVPTRAVEGLGDATTDAAATTSRMSLAMKGFLGLGAAVAFIEIGNAIDDAFFAKDIEVEKVLGSTTAEVKKIYRDLTEAAEIFGDQVFLDIGEQDITILYKMRDALGEGFDTDSPLGRAIRETERAMKETMATEGTYEDALAELEGQNEDTAGAVGAATAAIQEQADALRGAFDAERSAADAGRNALLAFDELDKARRAAAGDSDEYRDALERIADAESELSEARREATGDSDAYRRAQAAVADAERGVADAQRNTQQAQEALTRAREDAAETLDDLKRSAEGAALSEERAELRLLDARERLQELKNKPNTTERERLEAELAVREADLALREAQDSRDDTNQDLAAASDPENTEAVLAAKQAVADALQGEQDARARVGEAARAAQEVITDANARVREAEEKVAETTEAASEIIEEARGKVFEATRNLEDAILDQADAEAELAGITGDAADAQDAYREALERASLVLDPASPFRQNLTSYLEDLREIAGLDEQSRPTESSTINGGSDPAIPRRPVESTTISGGRDPALGGGRSINVQVRTDANPKEIADAIVWED